MKLILDRFTHNALALLAVTTILFFMFRLMPGTPLAAFINENLNADQQQAMLEQFGLDKPMWQQYFIYLGNLLRGEFGLSFFQRRPVLNILLEVLPNSLILTLASLIIAYIFGVLAGAWRQRQLVERIRTLAEHHQQPSIGAEFLDHVGAFIDGPDVVVLVDADRVREREAVAANTEFLDERAGLIELEQSCLAAADVDEDVAL